MTANRANRKEADDIEYRRLLGVGAKDATNHFRTAAIDHSRQIYPFCVLLVAYLIAIYSSLI